MNQQNAATIVHIFFSALPIDAPNHPLFVDDGQRKAKKHE
jgi:hypothetical protein